MKNINTIDGALLDYLVARVEGFKHVMHPDEAPIEQCFVGGTVYSPTYYDHQAKSIIDREAFDFCGEIDPLRVEARIGGIPNKWYPGRNMRVAAMRAWVAKNLGDDIPAHLLEPK